MKLANKVCLGALTMLSLVFAIAAQDNRNGLPLDDPRNTAPSVGTGGVAGGPTGLFTVYDGKTLRKGEYTFSAAYSNYDRDPGDVDITSVPLSFQFGLTNRLELYVGTEAWRGIKVNSPANLSSFYLPNSQLLLPSGAFGVPAAIVLAPGTTGPYSNRAVFRPANAPFCVFPYTGCNAGTYGAPTGFLSGVEFGFPTGTNATLGPPRAGGAADLFPGVGSVYGSILPGFVLTTTGTNCVSTSVGNCGVRPVSFSAAPSYLPDAPFVNRSWGTSSFNSIDFGAKWRINQSLKAVGYGFVFNYRWYLDKANDAGGFNMMQRGAGPGANHGDLSATFFVDGRLARWVNVSANVGYTYTTNPKGNFGGTDYTLLDRPDELNFGIGVDFPVNRHFQPILEFHHLRYVGGRTPNSLENNPYEGLAGARFFPARWWGFSAWYRYHFNQQDTNSFSDTTSSTNTFFQCGSIITAVCTPTTFTVTSTGIPNGLRPSSDPHGFGFQLFAGRRLPRVGPIENKPANVESVTLSGTTITLPCPAGTRSTGGCSDNSTISVATVARDPENDVLTYNYTVSGGRVVGTGANVSWDLSGVQAGTYTITAGVDDGCGVCGSTKTQTVTVAACSDCKPLCNCPTAPSITGPSGVTTPGQPMTFTATSSGDVSYNWTVSAGTITSGQGTSSITVDTTGLAGQNVTASVTISGGTITPDCGCPTTASETASVQAKPAANLVDQYGKLTNDDVKARIDGFYTTLNNDPSSHGYIIIYGTPAQIKAARAQIDKAIAFRKYDPSRVTIVTGPPQGDEVQVKLYQVPSGAENPQP